MFLGGKKKKKKVEQKITRNKLLISDLCNTIETTKDNLVNMAVKEKCCLPTKYLLKKTVDMLPDLLGQLQPFYHTIDSDSSQLNNLGEKKYN